MTNPYGRRSYRRNRLIVIAEAEGRCSVVGCRRPATTADHITPVCLGGTNDKDNLRAMCWHHNSQGGARITNRKKADQKVGEQSRAW